MTLMGGSQTRFPSEEPLQRHHAASMSFIVKSDPQQEPVPQRHPAPLDQRRARGPRRCLLTGALACLDIGHRRGAGLRALPRAGREGPRERELRRPPFLRAVSGVWAHPSFLPALANCLPVQAMTAVEGILVLCREGASAQGAL